MKATFNNFSQIARNLYKCGSGYFRLAGHSVTPNGCWISAPKMVQLIDIDAGTGRDVFGDVEFNFETGTVPAGRTFLTA